MGKKALLQFGSDVSEILMAPPGSQTPSYRSVHSRDSVVRRAVEGMPDAVDRIWNLRENLHKDYEAKRKPYQGELGLDSYQPWQIPDYIMVRKLVEEFADNFIVKHIPPDDIAYERDMKLQMLQQSNKDWHRTADTLSEQTAIKLVAEELVLEVTRKMLRETASEGIHQDVMFKRVAGNMMVKETEIQATGNPEGREPSDEAYDLLTVTFSTLQRHRDQHKKGLWTHSQPLTLSAAPEPEPLKRDRGPEPIQPIQPPTGKSKKGKAEPEPEVEEPLDSDVNLITHHHLIPVDPSVSTPAFRGEDPAVKSKRLWSDIYVKRELGYWKNLQPFVFSRVIPRRCQGVTCMKASPDHSLIAVGAASGDVLVLNTHVEPWSIAKFSVAKNTKWPVVSLAWTLDGTRLLAVHKSGNLFVWLTQGRPATSNELSTMGFPTDNAKPQPFALTPLQTMSAKNGDFNVTQGVLAGQMTQRDGAAATVGGFFPSLTLLASQVSVCAGMNAGDVLKLDLTSAGIDAGRGDADSAAVILKPVMEPDSEEQNRTQQGISVEFFRDHKHPILHLSFIANLGKMLTVDAKAFIGVWSYNRSHMTGFDYFIPEAKYKLDLNKTMYSPATSDAPRVIFSDQGRSNQLKIARERAAAERNLRKLKLSEPWHVATTQKPPLETYIYVPPGGAEGAGAMFNVVSRHVNTQQLSLHVTRMYKPIKVPSSKLVTLVETPSGNEIVFVLLYPEYPPKVPHLMILVLDLPTMKLRNFRRDINLTAQQFTEVRDSDVFSAGVSQVYGPTGANYLFMTLSGRLTCVSLNSGSDVLVIDSMSKPKVPKFPGLKLDEKQMALTKNHQVTTLGNLGSLYACMYHKNTPSLTVLRLEDKNPHEDSRLMCKAYERWESYHPGLAKTRSHLVHCPSELRINPVHSSLPDMKHKEAEMRSLLLGLPFLSEQQSESSRENQKIGNYLALENKIQHEGLLSDL